MAFYWFSRMHQSHAIRDTWRDFLLTNTFLSHASLRYCTCECIPNQFTTGESFNKCTAITVRLRLPPVMKSSLPACCQSIQLQQLMLRTINLDHRWHIALSQNSGKQTMSGRFSSGKCLGKKKTNTRFLGQRSQYQYLDTNTLELDKERTWTSVSYKDKLTVS